MLLGTGKQNFMTSGAFQSFLSDVKPQIHPLAGKTAESPYPQKQSKTKQNKFETTKRKHSQHNCL